MPGYHRRTKKAAIQSPVDLSVIKMKDMCNFSEIKMVILMEIGARFISLKVYVQGLLPQGLSVISVFISEIVDAIEWKFYEKFQKTI